MLAAASVGWVGHVGHPYWLLCVLEWGAFWEEVRQAPGASLELRCKEPATMVSAEIALGQQREEAMAVGAGELDAERITVKESTEVSEPGCVDVTGMDLQVPGTIAGWCVGSWMRPSWCGAESCRQW